MTILSFLQGFLSQSVLSERWRWKIDFLGESSVNPGLTSSISLIKCVHESHILHQGWFMYSLQRLTAMHEKIDKRNSGTGALLRAENPRPRKKLSDWRRSNIHRGRRGFLLI